MAGEAISARVDVSLERERTDGRGGTSLLALALSLALGMLSLLLGRRRSSDTGAGLSKSMTMAMLVLESSRDVREPLRALVEVVGARPESRLEASSSPSSGPLRRRRRAG